MGRIEAFRGYVSGPLRLMPGGERGGAIRGESERRIALAGEKKSSEGIYISLPSLYD